MKKYEHWTRDTEEAQHDHALVSAEDPNKADHISGMKLCCQFEAKTWKDASEQYFAHLRAVTPAFAIRADDGYTPKTKTFYGKRKAVTKYLKAVTPRPGRGDD